MGLLQARQYVVCVQQVHDDVSLKILSVDERGRGICKKDQGDQLGQEPSDAELEAPVQYERLAFSKQQLMRLTSDLEDTKL